MLALNTPPGSRSSIGGALNHTEALCAMGQANSQNRQGFITKLASSIPMIEPSSISSLAYRSSFSSLQYLLSKDPLRKASLGQALWQGLSQPLHGSKSIGPVGSSSSSMKIPRRRRRVPNSCVTRRLFLPITPRPARWAESLRKAPPYSIWYGKERALIPSSSPSQVRSFLDCMRITPLPGVKPGTFMLHQSSTGSEAGWDKANTSTDLCSSRHSTPLNLW